MLASMVRAANNVESYTKLAEFKASYADHRGEYEKDRPDTETLYKRALVYSGVRSTLFVIFLFFAPALYSFQSIRLFNIAFSLAFIG